MSSHGSGSDFRFFLGLLLIWPLADLNWLIIGYFGGVNGLNLDGY